MASHRLYLTRSSTTSARWLNDIHRIGRTGRAGKTGVAITLLAPREKRRLREVEALTRQTITKMELPSVGDIHRHRESQVVENLKIWLGRGRYKRELEMVQELIEAGHEPMNIAAAAIKIARADEKQRPIAEIADVKTDMTLKPDRDFSRGRRESPGRRDMPASAGGSNVAVISSHEEGMCA